MLDRNSLQSIYFAFIRPVLEYADVVWDNCTKYEEEELEKNQLEWSQALQNWFQQVAYETEL